MTHALIYPLASRRQDQWFADTHRGETFDHIEKLVLHTTECAGWPGYKGGAVAPNLTGWPNTSTRRIEWRQHFPMNMSSRALVHFQSQPTNGDHVVQVELIGTCVPSGPGIYWPKAPPWALQGVADFLVWLHNEWGVPIASSVAWRDWDAPGDHQRLSNAAYDDYRGVLGHQHVPQNDHRDPGSLDGSELIRLASASLGGKAMPTTAAPTLQEIQQGILYYDLGKDYVNPATILRRLYDMVGALHTMLAGETDAIAKRVVTLLPAGPAPITVADVEEAVRAVLREGPGA